ncbi:hypothetical protein BC828DRAFT_385864 [Blastocladiella britannica]|nr:hypothetical protein BC828DRAFT_385864 [Blastocladiella britannica]
MYSALTRRLYSSAAAGAVPAAQTFSRRIPIGINRVTLMGRVASAPRESALKDQPDRFMTALTLMTTDRFVPQPTDDKPAFKSEYHRIVTFDQGLHRYLMDTVQEGMAVYAEGKLVHTKFVDKEGATRYQTQVDVSHQSGGRIIVVDKQVPEGFKSGGSGGSAKPSSSSSSSSSSGSYRSDDLRVEPYSG